jgi:Uma2 family endonuclease
METSMRWTSKDLEALPLEDGTRYEIIDGELYASKQPDWEHQYVCVRLAVALEAWSQQTQRGLTLFAPGLVFAEDDSVAPDLVWISWERLALVRGVDGKLHAAPELVVEVLSPGEKNVQRDRDLKRRLYARRGVPEYWIIDWRERRVEIYQQKQAGLQLVATLDQDGTLQSPLLPGFSCPVRQLFIGLVPRRESGE